MAGKTDQDDNCLVSRPRYGITTARIIYDAPCKRGRKTQQIAKETRQPALNSACNPDDNQTKVPDESWKYFAVFGGHRAYQEGSDV